MKGHQLVYFERILTHLYDFVRLESLNHLRFQLIVVVAVAESAVATLAPRVQTTERRDGGTVRAPRRHFYYLNSVYGQGYPGVINKSVTVPSQSPS